MAGAPKFAESQTIPDVSYAGFAHSLGLEAMELHRADQLQSAWATALGTDRPTVLDVHSDPDVPPIPPHATLDQMKEAGKALLAGDEDAAGVVRTGVRQKVQEFLPGRKGS